VEGEQLLGSHAHPEVSMHTPSLAEYVRRLDLGDWQGVGELMLASANKLVKIGADFLVCPDNTIHQALHYAEPRSPLPWLHIAEVVAEEAVGRGFWRLGLIGTRWLVESDVYPKKLAARRLEYARPDAVEREEINRIIMDELVRGICKPEAIAYHQGVIGRMKDAGCDAVVLGCTETPLIMNDSNSPLPTLDSTRLLARAALRRAVGGAALPAWRRAIGEGSSACGLLRYLILAATSAGSSRFHTLWTARHRSARLSGRCWHGSVSSCFPECGLCTAAGGNAISRRARMADLGHLHPYAASSAIGCRAPKAVIRATAMEPPESTQLRHWPRGFGASATWSDSGPWDLEHAGAKNRAVLTQSCPPLSSIWMDQKGKKTNRGVPSQSIVRDAAR
jgi:aspartate racemase